MKLVETHNLKPTKELKYLTHASKNLYNITLYNVRQFYFKEKKYLNYSKLNKQFKEENNFDYRGLPAKVAQQTMKMVEQNFKSFFAALKEYKKDPSKFEKCPKPPKYKDKNGHFLLTYTNQAISKTEFQKFGCIKLSGTNISIKTQIKEFDTIQQVRIIPVGNHFRAEIVYIKQEPELIKNDVVAAIDLGINNLATVSFNSGKNAFAVNGRPLKSINQFFNKQKAKTQSTLERRNKKDWSKKMSAIQTKRNNKIKDYMHKASKLIVQKLVSNKVSTLVIGKNDGWKNEVNMGKKNNQNFVQIPFNQFIQMLSYKCRLQGINTVFQEESYTSKCSFLDREEICKHERYMGKRIKRGLFRTAFGRKISADLNGSYNIMKKAVSNFFLKGIDEIEGVLVHPKLITA